MPRSAWLRSTVAWGKQRCQPRRVERLEATDSKQNENQNQPLYLALQKMAKKRTQRIRRKTGNLVAIPLSDGTFGYGRVLQDPLMAFYRLTSPQIRPLQDVISTPIAFIVAAHDNAVAEGSWPIIGHSALTPELLQEPVFFKRDRISGALTVYRDSTGVERPATLEECAALERAAVWAPNHIQDRLEDMAAGRPNKWVESMRP